MNQNDEKPLVEVMCYNCLEYTAFPKKVGSMDYCLGCYADEMPSFVEFCDNNEMERLKNIRIVVDPEDE